MSSESDGFGLTPMSTPALDGALDNSFLIAGLTPQAGEAGIGRRRPLLRFEVVEPHANRDRHAFAADDALAIAQCRDRVEEASCALGHRRADTGLVAIVVQAHGDDRAALRQHAFGKVGRTLRNQAQTDAVLTAFLGDPLENAADGLP